MDIFRAVPKHHAAIGGTGQDHGKFAKEGDKAFVDQRLRGQFERGGLLRAPDPPLTLAIITVAAGFQNAGRTDLLHRAGQIGWSFNRSCAVSSARGWGSRGVAPTAASGATGTFSNS